MVAFGAASAFGEDYPASGRVLLVEVRRTTGTAEAEEAEWKRMANTPKPGSYRAALAGDAAWEAEVAYSREFRGPVTAVSAIDGALIVAYGSRVEALAWGKRGRSFFSCSRGFEKRERIEKEKRERERARKREGD